MAAAKKRVRRKRRKLSPEELTQICLDCGAKCCRYFALQIDEPDSDKEYEKVRWYLAHENTWVFVDEGKWYLLVNNKCRYLGQDLLCTVYDRRPDICRKHNQKNCERDSDIFYDIIFKSMEEFEQWLEDEGLV